MGCGASSPELQEQQTVSRQIDRALVRDREEQANDIKLLLLGSASAGKSTFAKQLKILFMGGFSAHELTMFKEQVSYCIWRNMRILAGRPEVKNDPEVLASCPRVMQMFPLTHEGRVADFASFTDELARMWQCAVVRAAAVAAGEGEGRIDQCLTYLMGELGRIALPDYLPNVTDILNVRTKTLGIVETEFVHKMLHIRLVDVGGQKNERRKWIHAFQDVTAVVYVVSLTDFDQLLEEDGETNRMQDSLVLFSQVVNNKWLNQTNVILFLNKSDLFPARLAASPGAFRACFPKATEATLASPALAIDCVRDAFLAQDQHATKERFTYPYETCATDTACVKRVFEAISDILLAKNIATFI